MSYLALYRKYRPKVFEDVIGQEHIVRTLQNQVKTDRVAHAYLFTGSRGTGKTSVAKIFARAVNCLTPINGSSCGKCENCQKLSAASSMTIIEMDAASHNGVDNIREINEEVKYTPAVGKYKVYIIDEVHMLSTGAFNALLKTLEEPPGHVIFILATTDPQKIPVTILSRCQRYDFKRISASQIKDLLISYMEKEQVQITDEALGYIARLADGGMRDALSILEQCVSFYFEEEITLDKVLHLVGAVDTKYLFDMIEAVIKKESSRAIHICDEINMQGRSIRQFNQDLLMHTRNLLVAKTTEDSASLLEYSKEHIEHLKNQAALLEVDTLMRYIHVFSELDQSLKVSSRQRVLLEVALLKLCEVEMDTSKESLMDKINDLESKLNQLVARGLQISQPKEGTQLKSTLAKEVKPIRLPEAVPEDLLEVPKRWAEILQKLPLGAKLALGSASPGVLEGDLLYIVHAKGMEPPITEQLNAIKKVISDVLGKEVKVVPMRDKVYNKKSQELYGTHPEKTKTVVAINGTLEDIQSKVNYDIREMD